MRLKLIIIVSFAININSTNCMDLYMWLKNRFIAQENSVFLEVKQEQSKTIYYKSNFDEIPTPNKIGESRTILKKKGVSKSKNRMCALKDLINNMQNVTTEEQNCLNTEQACNLIIACYSMKTPGKFNLNYLKLIDLISKYIQHKNSINPEMIFQILIKMPTLYSILKDKCGLIEISYGIVSQENSKIYLKSYAKLLLNILMINYVDLNNNNLSIVFDKQSQDILIKILIGKIGGSIELLKLICNQVESEANYLAIEIAQIKGSLEETKQIFEKATKIKGGAVHIWAFIKQRINDLKSQK